MYEQLAREATRKIDTIFSQVFPVMHSENKTLKSKVCFLESLLKTMTENYENARKWRENVLSGCPVLFEQSGLVYTLKPIGTLKAKVDEVSMGVTDPSPAAEPQRQHDAGESLEEKSVFYYTYPNPNPNQQH